MPTFFIDMLLLTIQFKNTNNIDKTLVKFFVKDEKENGKVGKNYLFAVYLCVCEWMSLLLFSFCFDFFFFIIPL